MMNRSLVYVVGLGPGGAQFLTAQAQTALQAADVLCGYTVYIDLVRPLYPDKEVYATGMTRERLACAAAGDFCLALYNPSSRGRADYLQKAVRILRDNGKGPDTVCGLVRCIGRDGQTARLLTLAELEDTAVDMFTTVFVGNAATQILHGRMVTPRGYRGV